MSVSAQPRHHASPGRRSILLAGFAFGGICVLGRARLGLADGPVIPPDRFLALSRFLTGRQTLDPGLARRYQAALHRHDAGFTGKFVALERDLNDSHAADMDGFLSGTVSAPSRETARTIVSAWYLGVVGREEKAELIAFDDALMYDSTRSILAVPTYGLGPLYWGDKPRHDF